MKQQKSTQVTRSNALMDMEPAKVVDNWSHTRAGWCKPSTTNYESTTGATGGNTKYFKLNLSFPVPLDFWSQICAQPATPRCLVVYPMLKIYKVWGFKYVQTTCQVTPSLFFSFSSFLLSELSYCDKPNEKAIPKIAIAMDSVYHPQVTCSSGRISAVFLERLSFSWRLCYSLSNSSRQSSSATFSDSS